MIATGIFMGDVRGKFGLLRLYQQKLFQRVPALGRLRKRWLAMTRSRGIQWFVILSMSVFSKVPADTSISVSR